ncbi:MAG TPA: ABC transporter permease [Actinophytocola sp.]|uniref:ABC transporter permease n=1 Tax=Actinophytocola sp. TaxID=1872138 RepID=UPI002DC01DD9|nr:ABC transporter permease [Actinophytocola sp.]HEU5472951.1 ABC transporter permease [Actinophytocola sp.]
MTATHPSGRGTTGLAFAAFAAILHRDIVVTARGFVVFAVHAFVQPVLFLFVFGVVLPATGLAVQGYGALLLPGIVTMTVFFASAQAVMAPLAVDLCHLREIDDRLLAPTPVPAIVLEKIAFAALRGVLAAAILFPLAPLVLGGEFQVRADSIPLLAGIVVLTAIVSAAGGLVFGVLVPTDQLGLAFAALFTPLVFTGCLQYPWSTLDTLPGFQIVTLVNPLTYSAEGLRFAMIPALPDGTRTPTLDIAWAVAGLIAFTTLFLVTGMRAFHRRAIH